ncbi:MAG: carbohydrate porin [Oscillatoriales cyanobacterium C42_A2020_001]|nr:carbohydrate porin [Leptolyngbyaceae cyanobacterium C42_A2020_001]
MSGQRWNLWMILAASAGLWLNGAIASEAKPVQVGNITAQGTATPESHSSALDPATTLQQIGTYGLEGKTVTATNPVMGQVTSVSQFSDVNPRDWAFQALQSLVERYGCIVGYPDKTYRGNRALTRYEFAAGLNACLDKIQELIAAATADFVRKEDLEVVKRLQEEFAAELAALRGRVEALEVRTATLEKQQFSTTTKLAGEVIFSVADTFGDRATRTGNDSFVGSGVTNAATERALRDDNTETIFGDRARLVFDTSFTGRDRLRTRLNAINLTPFAGAFTGTNETRLSFDGNNGNAIEVDKLYYRFPVGDKLRIQVDAFGTEYNEGYISTLSLFESASQSAISRFSRFNPIFRTNNPGGAGITFNYDLSPQFALQGGFVADTSSNDPGQKNGIFNGNYSAIGQLVFRPSRAFDIGFTYVHAYFSGNNVNGLGVTNTASPLFSNPFNQPGPNLTGSTGTGYASNPFNGEATTFNNLGAQVQWRLSRAITVGGWYGYGFAGNRRSSEEARISNWAAFVGFPDFGKKGSLLGFLFGVSPRVVDNDFRPRITTGPLIGQPNPNLRRRIDEDPPYHLEAFYRYRINDNISITPGVFVLFNPQGNNANSTQVVGVVRTTFSF